MSILERKIRNFTDSIEKSIESQNYFAALTISLTLPDILGKLENPSLSSSKRYAQWFNEYLKEEYSMTLQGKEHIFLSGNDAYALRCSFLHGGEADISTQRIQEVLESFIFKVPDIFNGKTGGSHNIRIENKLFLRIDLFCQDICKAAKKWISVNSNDNRIENSAAKIMDFQGESYISDDVRID